MHPDISAASGPPAASKLHHRYDHLTAALRQRGLECTVEWGLSAYIVHAELPDGSSLIISPPQEPPSEHPEHPESWIVTRHRSAEPAVYEVVYNSEPDGPDARHGGSVPDLLNAVETRLDQLGVPRQEQERHSEEHPTEAVVGLPDLAFGHHPDHGIVAANPKNLAAGTWMLERLDFHLIPDDPTLYALAHQERDGPGRTARAVELLRNSGYRVDVDAALDPSLALEPTTIRERLPLEQPDVAFAEHPQLGIVAAINNRVSGLTELALVGHGWRRDPSLDIYTLHDTGVRHEALGKVADATVALHRFCAQVAVQPRLAQDMAARSRSTSSPVISRERGLNTRRKSPFTTVALGASPARAGFPGEAPAPAVAAAVRPVDPRIAFSRGR
ncbi:hypothetical protein ACGFYT_27525 [Streptomyces sp. NPDC048208]|uniref:hypothetical protein n=1 Tax=Streptomyces sp. NPDC048208 TaxID=3365515 RepID=UPI0037100B49